MKKNVFAESEKKGEKKQKENSFCFIYFQHKNHLKNF